MKAYFPILLYLFSNCVFSQSQSSNINAVLDVNTKTIKINQEIIFHNHSKDTLNNIYLHSWMNSYRDRNTPLSKRLIEDYDKGLFFSKQKDRGFLKINSFSNKFEEVNSDIIKILLNRKLVPKDSIKIIMDYQVKIPNDKFTKYGYHKNNYNLKYWYLTPVVYQNGWKTMNNYNMDDLYCDPTNFNVQFSTPSNYTLNSSLNIVKQTLTKHTKTYTLKGKNHSDIEIVIKDENVFNHINTPELKIITNLNTLNLDNALFQSIASRQLDFIETVLGKYPHQKIFINKIIYDKNPVYGLNQLPKILNPFNKTFLSDIQLFKALSYKYINNTLLTNKRENYWINDGIQIYLMLKYVEKYYPEKKALGAISKIWGVRSYKLAKLNFNDKYAFVNQFAMRKNLDQPLTKHADSLSTFNRKIVNKYKAGLGLVYLSDYLEDNIVTNSIKEYYKSNLLRNKEFKSFKSIITSNTFKNLNWFFNDYLQTNKKLDYTIKRVKISTDSINIIIKNKSNFIAPITLYGIKNKEIKFKKWITNVSDFSTITIPNGDFDKLVLNYEAKYPEINLNDNWKNLKPSLLNKPLRFSFMEDIDDPNYNQVFYNFEYSYNYYNGVILGLKIGNQTLFKKKWIYKIKPTFGFKNNEINGSVATYYTLYPKQNSIYKFRSGFSYSTYNYAPELSYKRISPFINIDFKRKNLRDVGGKYLFARYLMIDKETAKNEEKLEENKYGVLNIKHGFYKPDIIKNIYYTIDFQLANNFSKVAFVSEYRKLQKNNTQIDLRLFAGTFVYNNTESGFFDFSLNRPSDYLFDYSYFGRSEKTGFLSQQIIIAEGGFKSIFKKNTANQWMITSNGSFGLWRWFEIYGDVGFYKNRKNSAQFKYDSGIRLNFVQNFFEIYFPIQSSNGFEIKQKKYPEKIRFVLTLNINKIYNFIKRGFY